MATHKLAEFGRKVIPPQTTIMLPEFGNSAAGGAKVILGTHVTSGSTLYWRVADDVPMRLCGPQDDTPDTLSVRVLAIADNRVFFEVTYYGTKSVDTVVEQVRLRIEAFFAAPEVLLTLEDDPIFSAENTLRPPV